MSNGHDEALNQVFGKLEGAEQAVIQHLRTSGLRKASETSLVDEIMNIRRERRRIFSDLLSVCESLRNQCRHLEVQLAGSREDQVTLKKTAAAHVEEIKETAARDLNSATAALKKTYESRLREVGERLEIVASSRNEHEERQLRQTAAELTRTELAKQQEAFDAKLLKYKQALREIVERETQTQAMVSRQTGLYQEAAAQVRSLQQAMEAEQDSKRQALEHTSHMRTQLEICQQQLEEEKMRSQSLLVELKRRGDRAAAEERSLADKHATELASIDEKVRTVLSKKDEAIHRLEKLNRQLLREQSAMQQDLQTVFSAGP
jgi:hypothetical protein